MLNNVNLSGTIAKDIELKQTPSGINTTTFTIAVNRTYKGKDGEKQTDFINIVAWKHTAEFVAKYFTKGQQIIVSGRLQTRTWEKDGKKQYATEVLASEVFFAGSKNSSNNPSQAVANGNDISNDFATILQDDPNLPF